MNPLKVLEEVYGVIEDRKLHPKEGSYTNYLFEKGIDKILKKVGRGVYRDRHRGEESESRGDQVRDADFSITAWWLRLKKESPGRISPRNWLTEGKKYKFTG